jgi:hypothetical protein
VLAALALTISLAVAPKPHVIWKPIPYGPSRKAEMAAYAKKHYGIHSWRLHPKVIVEHYTGSNSFLAAWNTFAANTPDPELGELPGTVRTLHRRPERQDLPARAPERHVPPHRRAQLRRDRHRARRHV